jgi:hypothetical protein
LKNFKILIEEKNYIYLLLLSSKREILCLLQNVKREGDKENEFVFDFVLINGFMDLCLVSSSRFLFDKER